MSLNIKNPETYRLVKELADATGLSMTAAVTDAVKRRLDEVRVEHGQAELQVQLILAAWGELGDRLGTDYLSQDFDAVLYDERGLPR